MSVLARFRPKKRIRKLPAALGCCEPAASARPTVLGTDLDGDGSAMLTCS